LCVGDVIQKIENKPVLELGYFEVKNKMQIEGTYIFEINRKDSIFTKEIEVFDIMSLL